MYLLPNKSLQPTFAAELNRYALNGGRNGMA